MKRGVFWLIDDKLLCYPFDGSIEDGIAKSGNTYNHRKLWKHIRCCDKKVGFDYYPRGRVEITRNGKAKIYMSSHIGNKYIARICEAFELDDKPVVKYDHSEHYRCHFDWDE